MSLGEILIILLISILVLKPGDINLLIKNIQKIRNYFFSLKKDILHYVTEMIEPTQSLQDEAKELNFYLKKIVDIEGNYDGNYSLSDLKEKYEQLNKSIPDIQQTSLMNNKLSDLVSIDSSEIIKNKNSKSEEMLNSNKPNAKN